MTIAAGFLCAEGVILAADTCIVTSDGKKQDGAKVGAMHGKNGSYAIANSAEDGNAANTVAIAILKYLESNDLDNPTDVELAVEQHMVQWWNGFGHNKPPAIQFVLGAVIKGVPRIYFCEPPNTVLPRMDYVGIGTGASTTDPLVSTLFPGYEMAARVRLWQISYLFYRAKKDDAFCGGRTTPIFLPLDGQPPMYISHAAMEEAEKLGPNFDFYLRETLKSCMTALDGKQMISSMDTLAQVMNFTSRVIADLKFSPLTY